MPLVEIDVEQWAAGGVVVAIILKQQAEIRSQLFTFSKPHYEASEAYSSLNVVICCGQIFL